MKRREYMTGLLGSAGVLTVSPSGEIREHSDPNRVSHENTPPREGESVMGLTVDPIKPVRVGIIGLGNRGFGMTKLIDAMHPDKAVINAICDVRPEPVKEMESYLQEQGQDPATYTGNEYEWLELVERRDLDAVFIFTPHQWHAKMAVKTMEEGKHAFTEVPAATTIEECWELVNTAERTQKNCMMLENVCYFQTEMWVLNMVRQGVFGDQLTYASGGYIHPLTLNYFFRAYYNDWRARNHLKYKGDLYPTHGLGPHAWNMNIMRGNRFEYIVSQESPSTQMQDLAEELPEDHWAYGIDDWANGDTTRSLIMTNQEQPIELQFDVKTNRGYSRLNELAGVDAFHKGFPESRLAVDGEAKEFLSDETYQNYWETYQHPLWTQLEDLAEKYGGHGGGDFLELYRVFDALNAGRALDIDVYDSVAWSAPRPLSAISIEHGGKPVKFPDFTRGDWEDDSRQLQVMDFGTIQGPRPSFPEPPLSAPDDSATNWPLEEPVTTENEESSEDSTATPTEGTPGKPTTTPGTPSNSTTTED